MAKLDVYKAGKKSGSVDLSDKIAQVEVDKNLLHRAVVAEEANSRQGTQKAKTRSETKGGGRKPYKQKKTGRARQGTTRAPHYAHGGMALAVSPRDYTKKLNVKERRAAIKMALAKKVSEESVIVADSIMFTEPKTKAASEFLKSIGVEMGKRVLVVLPSHDGNTYKSFRNIPNVVVRTAPAKSGSEEKSATFSARDVLIASKVIIAKDALAKIEEVWS